jgi:RNA polymerase sigma-70 factor (ECF subfamily)
MAPPPDSGAIKNAQLAQLLARTAIADQQAFAELYRLTSAQLFAIALRIVRDRASAEEILQEAYVSIWHHAGSYSAARGEPRTWLATIVRNRCLDSLRRRELDTVAMPRDESGEELDLPADGPTPVELLLASAAARAVRDCVDGLDGAQKQAIALAFYHGLSHAELAAQLREPLGTVKSWIRRGLERLKRCLDRAGALT